MHLHLALAVVENDLYPEAVRIAMGLHRSGRAAWKGRSPLREPRPSCRSTAEAPDQLEDSGQDPRDDDEQARDGSDPLQWVWVAPIGGASPILSGHVRTSLPGWEAGWLPGDALLPEAVRLPHSLG